jgi:hypothetical protein
MTQPESQGERAGYERINPSFGGSELSCLTPLPAPRRNFRALRLDSNQFLETRVAAEGVPEGIGAKDPPSRKATARQGD